MNELHKNIDKEIVEEVEKRTMHDCDVDKHTLKHKLHKDLQHLQLE